MEIHHLGRLCLLVTALLSLDLFTKFSQISLTFSAVKACSYLFKFLIKRPELGSALFAQFVTGIVLFFAFSVGLKVLNFSFMFRDHLRDDDCVNSKVCDLMEPLERPTSVFENGHAITNGDSRSVDGSEYYESEGSRHGDQVFDEMSLREFSLSADICDQMVVSGRTNSVVENGGLVPPTGAEIRVQPQSNTTSSHESDEND